MKILVFVFVSFLGFVCFGKPSCVDISGTYRFSVQEEEAQTRIVYKQFDCTSIFIGGSRISSLPPYSTVYQFTIPLSGQFPRAFDCLKAAPGTCASYKADLNFVLKVRSEEAADVTLDPVHGTCFYLESQLFKNSDGDLVEIPVAKHCDDGFVGLLTPIVYPKVTDN